MKLKLSVLTRPGFLPAFVKLCSDPFTPAEKFRLAKSRRAVEEARANYSDVHDGLVKQFSADGNGDAVDLADAVKLSGFKQAIAELHAQEFELPLAGKLKLSDQTRLDANDIAELMDLLEEPAETKT